MGETQVQDAISIAVIGGDGIGPEVIAEARKVVEATGVRPEWIERHAPAGRLRA